MQSTCVVCEKDYDTNESTATRQSNKDSSVIKTIYCSIECEAIDLEWLDNANEIMQSAKANNPQMFMRTSMNQEQEQAMNTFKSLGVKFKGTELSNKEGDN